MDTAGPFDEMWGTDGQLCPPYRGFYDWFDGEDLTRLRKKQRDADDLFRLTGITFNVYGKAEAEERLIPFDIIPRIISGGEWHRLSRGIEQRVRAINAFLHDIYHNQEIIRAGRIPEEMISRNAAVVSPGEKVLFRIFSNDVIHGFNIPAVGITAEFDPGKERDVWIRAPKEPGKYLIQCLNYCGIGHAQMKAWLVVEGAEA